MAIAGPVGIRRVKRPNGMEDDVWIEDSGMGFHVTEPRYLDKGYTPLLSSLPWISDEEAHDAKGS